MEKKIISSTDVNKVLKDDGVEAIDTVNYQNLSNIDIEVQEIYEGQSHD